MGIARNLAALLDSSGDVVAGALDNAGGGGGGAWEVVSTTTLTSSVTSIDYALTGYSNFMIIMDNVVPANTANRSFQLRLSTDGGSTYLSATGSYHNSARSTASNGTGVVVSSGNTTQGLWSGSYMNSTKPSSGELHISVANPTTVTYRTSGYVYNSSERYTSQGLVALQSGQATHIRLKDYNGTGFGTGTFTLYGIKTS